MLTKRLGVTSRKEAFEVENFVWHMRMMDAVIQDWVGLWLDSRQSQIFSLSLLTGPSLFK